MVSIESRPDLGKKVVFVCWQEERRVSLYQFFRDFGPAQSKCAWPDVIGFSAQVFQQLNVKPLVVLSGCILVPSIPLFLSVKPPQLRLMLRYDVGIEGVSDGAEDFAWGISPRSS